MEVKKRNHIHNHNHSMDVNNNNNNKINKKIIYSKINESIGSKHLEKYVNKLIKINLNFS
jgi:hypothetical protein